MRSLIQEFAHQFATHIIYKITKIMDNLNQFAHIPYNKCSLIWNLMINSIKRFLWKDVSQARKYWDFMILLKFNESENVILNHTEKITGKIILGRREMSESINDTETKCA